MAASQPRDRLLAVAVEQAMPAGLIERIKNVRFSTTRLAPGYDEEEVDTFLDKLVAVLSEDSELDRSELHEVRFSRTRLRPGVRHAGRRPAS